ncbi:MAG: hypothetical protein MI799_11605 [Desulfobacterales bacterium]|nr:hypothetical protein [Desulfobacterales bacterium]
MKKLMIFFVLVFSSSAFIGCVGTVTSQQSASNQFMVTTHASPPAHKIVTFDVIGKGIEPEGALSKGQAVLMAERAAVADGYRQFVEKIRGVYVDAYMKSGHGAVNWDVVKTSTQSWLRGVELIEVKHAAFGIIEAHMQLRVNFVKDEMIWWPTGIDDNISASL